MRSFKSPNFLRTNQFEVKNQLDGLEERFRVQHRESLGDALNSRLTTLHLSPKTWHPEILALLLELSDQPLYKTRLSDVDGLRPDQLKPADQLRWEDIAKEDGWDDDPRLWKTYRYRGDTSDDDISITESEASEPPSTQDSGDGVNVGLTAEDHIIRPDNAELLNSICEAQQWRTAKPTTDAAGNARKIAVHELNFIREVLFMLQGLNTTMFDSKCQPLPSFQTAHLSWDTHRAVINAFSESGRQLRILRRFTEGYQEATHAEAFQDCVSKRLHDLDTKLSDIRQRLAAPTKQEVVSLVSLKSELTPWLEPLHALSAILVLIDQEPDPGAFRYLELLYDRASSCQLGGQTKIYEFLARIFMECFNVYLRPIRLWMDQGKLLSNDKIFFVCETEHDLPLSELWRGRFELRETQEGRLHAPAFLQPSVARIINAGKNIVVLNRLGQDVNKGAQEPPLDYDTVCPPGFDLAPFPELFASAFDRWIQSKYRATSTILKNVLCDKCGLPSALESMQRLYLMTDGSASSTFCDEVFERIDSLERGWHDRYALTAIAHDAFVDTVDTSRLSASVAAEARNIPAVESRSLIRSALPFIEITYRLPWPVQMVLSPHSIALYQSIFTLLLQFKRATSMLHKPKILEHYWTDNGAWAERALYYSCRNSLLWFCMTIQTYLATLVLAPNVEKLKQSIQKAEDVDTLTYVHDVFVKTVVDEACLGTRLAPIREGILDALDLAIKLESQHPDEEYVDVLRSIKTDFDKHLGFVIGGLKSVARASSDAQAAKWDTLAEMLHAGS